MIKTSPGALVCDVTKPPWIICFNSRPGDAFCVIASPHRTRAICTLEPDGHTLENARLICAAQPLLKVAQKLLLWMEGCMPMCDFSKDDMDLYHELRQTIRTAGGFSSDTHWWQGQCICSACSHAWQGVVEIPVEATSPQTPLECSECHQMTGGPA
jgi:hypothetical protein